MFSEILSAAIWKLTKLIINPRDSVFQSIVDMEERGQVLCLA